jgi:multiple sugar transport system permease protein
VRTRTRFALVPQNLLFHAALAAVFLIILGPIMWLLLNSFKTNVDALSIPPRIFFKPTFANYPAVMLQNPDFFRFYLNSIISSVLSTAVVLILGIPAAYALARFQFRGKLLLGFAILATRMVPTIAIGIPMFLIMMRAGLLDTYTALVVSYVAFNLPFGIWLMVGFFKTIPVELEEAAAIDGCSRLQAIARVVLPLTGPGLSAAGILVTIVCWREFFLPLILTDTPHAKPLSVVAGQFITEYGIDWGKMSAFSMLTFLPVILIAVYAQKYLVSGLTMGAIKE